MTAEHMRVLLHNERDSDLLFEMALDVVRADIPEAVLEAIRLGQDDSPPKTRRRHRRGRHLATIGGKNTGTRNEPPHRSGDVSISVRTDNQMWVRVHRAMQHRP